MLFLAALQHMSDKSINTSPLFTSPYSPEELHRIRMHSQSEIIGKFMDSRRELAAGLHGCSGHEHADINTLIAARAPVRIFTFRREEYVDTPSGPVALTTL
jgi:hypothetical protein